MRLIKEYRITLLCGSTFKFSSIWYYKLIKYQRLLQTKTVYGNKSANLQAKKMFSISLRTDIPRSEALWVVSVELSGCVIYNRAFCLAYKKVFRKWIGPNSPLSSIGGGYFWPYDKYICNLLRYKNECDWQFFHWFKFLGFPPSVSIYIFYIGRYKAYLKIVSMRILRLEYCDSVPKMGTSLFSSPSKSKIMLSVSSVGILLFRFLFQNHITLK